MSEIFDKFKKDAQEQNNDVEVQFMPNYHEETKCCANCKYGDWQDDEHWVCVNPEFIKYKKQKMQKPNPLGWMNSMFVEGWGVCDKYTVG